PEDGGPGEDALAVDACIFPTCTDGCVPNCTGKGCGASDSCNGICTGTSNPIPACTGLNECADNGACTACLSGRDELCDAGTAYGCVQPLPTANPGVSSNCIVTKAETMVDGYFVHYCCD
ncbi:MAG: hypothetical protein ACREJX_19155, partial [Polyangiaceae bacterium]